MRHLNHAFDILAVVVAAAAGLTLVWAGCATRSDQSFSLPSGAGEANSSPAPTIDVQQLSGQVVTALQAQLGDPILAIGFVAVMLAVVVGGAAVGYAAVKLWFRRRDARHAETPAHVIEEVCQLKRAVLAQVDGLTVLTREVQAMLDRAAREKHTAAADVSSQSGRRRPPPLARTHPAGAATFESRTDNET